MKRRKMRMKRKQSQKRKRMKKVRSKEWPNVPGMFLFDFLLSFFLSQLELD